MNPNLINNKAEHQFELPVEGEIAKLLYTLKGNILYLNYAYVPGNLRGKGVGGELMEAVLEYAQNEEWKVIPICSYTVFYLEEHPKWHRLLPNDY